MSSKAFSLCSRVSAVIILRKLNILVSSKNICSVRHKPIPSAPNLRACSASFGVSALVLTFSLLVSSAQLINVSKSPLIVGSSVLIIPSYTLPVEPSKLISSPSWYTLPFVVVKVLFSSLTVNSPQPDTQHLPIPRATTAAWLVIPPRIVSIPSAWFIPSISSGLVSSLTKIVFSPALACSVTSSAVK